MGSGSAQVVQFASGTWHLDAGAHSRGELPDWRELREAGGVQRLQLPGGPRIWAVTRYHDVLDFWRAEELTRDWRQAQNPDCGYGTQRYPEDYFAATPRNLFNTEGADHARLYGLTVPFFTKQRIDVWRPFVTETVNRAADRLGAKARAELVAEFAVPVPLTVIGRLLGIPDELHAQFAEHLRTVSAWLDPATPQWQHASRELHRLALRVMARKWSGSGDDLIAMLIDSHKQHGTMSRQEIASIIVILLATGYETTAALLAEGALAMVADPALRQRLTGAADKAGGAIDELLRRTPPSPFGQVKLALRDTQLGGAAIHAGDLVFPLIDSANRDDTVYQDPDRLCPAGREPRHLSFGRGRRRCMGSELARLVARVALTTLARRFPAMALAEPQDKLTRSGILHLRILDKLPVHVHGPTPTPGTTAPEEVLIRSEER